MVLKEPHRDVCLDWSVTGRQGRVVGQEPRQVCGQVAPSREDPKRQVEHFTLHHQCPGELGEVLEQENDYSKNTMREKSLTHHSCLSLGPPALAPTCYFLHLPSHYNPKHTT